MRASLLSSTLQIFRKTATQTLHLAQTIPGIISTYEIILQYLYLKRIYNSQEFHVEANTASIGNCKVPKYRSNTLLYLFSSIGSADQLGLQKAAFPFKSTPSGNLKVQSNQVSD